MYENVCLPHISMHDTPINWKEVFHKVLFVAAMWFYCGNGSEMMMVGEGNVWQPYNRDNTTLWP